MTKNAKEPEYSQDPTIRAGQIARAKSGLPATATEQLHQGPPDPPEGYQVGAGKSGSYADVEPSPAVAKAPKEPVPDAKHGKK